MESTQRKSENIVEKGEKQLVIGNVWRYTQARGENMQKDFSHFDEEGNAVMVDVTGKQETYRSAVASGFIQVNQKTVSLLAKSYSLTINMTISDRLAKLKKQILMLKNSSKQ